MESKNRLYKSKGKVCRTGRKCRSKGRTYCTVKKKKQDKKKMLKVKEDVGQEENVEKKNRPKKMWKVKARCTQESRTRRKHGK